MNATEALATIRRYHEQTKHHPDRHARGPGHLDWANQPEPFREFAGAPALDLPLADRDDSPLFVATMVGSRSPARPLDLVTLGRFLENALGLAAWKQSGHSRWALRVNPSSGNLHPTEAYLLLPPLEGRLDDASRLGLDGARPDPAAGTRPWRGSCAGRTGACRSRGLGGR